MRAPTLLAWLSLALAAALLAGAVGLGSARPSGVPGLVDYRLSTGAFPAVIAVYVGVGAFLLRRRPANPIGWLLAGQGLLNLLGEFGGAYALYGRAVAREPLPLAPTGAWLYGWTWLASIILLWLAVLLFPTGRPPTPRWRPVVGLSLAALALVAVVAALNWPYRAEPALVTLDRPVFLGPAAALGRVAVPLVFATAGLAALSVPARFRRAGEIERQQIKWLLFAAALMAGGSLVFIVTGSTPEVDAPLVGQLLSLAGLLGVPLAIGIAVLRYRLYDIDLLINRGLVYAALTLALGAVYFASVVSLEFALRGLTGGDSPLAVVVSTLVIAALFSPLRRQIQRVIDRRFYRRKYNAQQVLSAFGATLRHEVDLAALHARLLAAVEETMQPAHASLWLRPPTEASEARRASIPRAR